MFSPKWINESLPASLTDTTLETQAQSLKDLKKGK